MAPEGLDLVRPPVVTLLHDVGRLVLLFVVWGPARNQTRAVDGRQGSTLDPETYQ